MNEQTNPKRTGGDQADLENRYATARNIAIALFTVVFIGTGVFFVTVLTGLLGGWFYNNPDLFLGISFVSVFLAVVSGWVGVFFAIRALFFRSKLHFGTTETITDSILAALVKRVGKHVPAGLISQSGSQEPQHASADELAELRRELAELRREREERMGRSSTRSPAAAVSSEQ